MARRFASAYQSEPMSALATWGRRLAIFALLATVLSVAVIRFGFLEFKPALATFFGALACAALSILICFAAFIAIWQNGSRGLGRILAALLIDGAILAYPAYLALQYQRLPAIYDVTTDPIDPPKFEALARLRTGDGVNPAAYAGLYSAERQRAAYPDIEPLMLEAPPQRAYEAALAVVAKRRWQVVDARAPLPPRREGRIEAIARTPIMSFREDISIRVKPDGTGSKIDLRSSSRYFDHDLGANAARISALIEDINATADNSPSVAPVKQPAAAKSAQGKGQTKR